MVVDRFINLLQPALRRVRNDFGPSLIGFTECYCIGVSRSAVMAPRLSRSFGYVWATHDYRNAGRAECVCKSVSTSNHSRHCSDTYETDLLLPRKPHQLLLVHGLGIAVDQQHFVLRWSE